MEPDTAAVVLSLPNNHLQDLLRISRTTFTELERWHTARSDHPQAQAVIVKVNHEVVEVCRTLGKSRNVSSDAHFFAEEAAALCAWLKNEDQIDALEKEDQVKEISNQARLICKDIKDLHARCHNHHINMVQACRQLRKILKDIDTENLGQEKQRNGMESKSMFASMGVSVAKLAVLLFGVGPALEIVPVVAFIVLPVAIAGVEYGVPYLEGINEQISERSVQILQCEEAIEQLESGSKGLLQLEQLLGEVAAWWDRVNAEFEIIVKRVEGLQTGSRMRFDLQKHEKNFQDISKSFLDYKVTLGTVGAYFPSSIQSILEEPRGNQAQSA